MNPLILYDLLYYYPVTTLFVHGVGGEWNLVFLFYKWACWIIHLSIYRDR